jgi:DNA-binding transcriptional LysR family regulator
MELRHLRSFVAVAAERNFTRAADRLGIAQPPLSRQIRELETELGAALFDRTSRPVRLTEAGRLLYEQAVQLLGGIEQIAFNIRQLAATGRSRFVIGVVGSIMYGALPEVIRRFRDQAADTEVELIELTTVQQVEALHDGRIDAGFGRVRIDDPAIRREVLYNEPLVAALSSCSRLAQHDGPVRLADLCRGVLLIYPSVPRPSYADQVLGLLRDHGCSPERIVEVREVQTALGLVAAQSGCAIVPSSMQHLQRSDIRYAPILEPLVSPIILSQRKADEGEHAQTIRSIGRSVFSDVSV